jgi:hypothetical protein
MARYDVITLGETMLHFTPPGLRRLEQATTLELDVGVTVGRCVCGIAVQHLGRHCADRPAGSGNSDCQRRGWTPTATLISSCYDDGL